MWPVEGQLFLLGFNDVQDLIFFCREHNATFIRFDFLMKARRRRTAWHGYQWWKRNSELVYCLFLPSWLILWQIYISMLVRKSLFQWINTVPENLGVNVLLQFRMFSEEKKRLRRAVYHPNLTVCLVKLTSSTSFILLRIPSKRACRATWCNNKQYNELLSTNERQN